MATPDFRFRSQFPISGVANLIASKRQREEQIRESQQQQKSQKFNDLMRLVQLGSTLATQGVARADARQKEQARTGLADAVANLSAIQERQGETFLQSPIQQFGPGGQPTGAVTPTLQQTTALPAAQTEARRAAALVSPGSAAQRILQPPKPVDPLERELTQAKIEKIRAPKAPTEGDKLLSVFATRSALRNAGFSAREIRAGVAKDGTKLPKRISKREASAIRKTGFSFDFGSIPPEPTQGGGAPTAESVSGRLGF